MNERPLVHCDLCRGACVKLISGGAHISGMRGGKATYDFVDFNTTGKPVRINSKRQWQSHLKNLGMNDDVPNDSKEMQRSLTYANRHADKNKQKRELKEAIVSAVKDKKHIYETKQKVLKEVQKASKIKMGGGG